jgi:putative SOS response-associated peptidase YedK
MCGRYSIGKSKNEIERRFEAEMLKPFEPRYNLAPTQLAPVISSDSKNGFSHFYWGTTPEFSKNRPVSERLIHARAETVGEKAAFKVPFQRKRCLIPADGFYKWKTIGKKTRVPYRFTIFDDRLFAFAGLWDEYENENGEINHTFLLLTTSSNPLVSEIGDRMPVILSPENEKKWLDTHTSPKDLLQMLQPYQEEPMISYTVSPMVNQTTIDSPTLIKKTSPMDQFGNYTLFG